MKLDVLWHDILPGQGIELAVEQDGTIVPDWPNRPIKAIKLPSDGIYLKLAKVDDTYEASYSFDDTTWTQLGSLPARKMTDLQVGLFATGSVTSQQGAPDCAYTASEIPVDFDFFHVNIPPSNSDVTIDNNSQAETIILTTAQDNETYNWIDSKPYVTSKHSIDGDVGFIPTENNHFTGQFGIIGYEPNEIRFIRFGLYLIRKDAGLLLQVSFNGDFEHRWAFDGRESYQGGYGWAKKGETLDLPVGEWVMVELDLIDQLGARPGQQLTGLAFSGADGNLVYDRVSVDSESSVSSQNSSK